MKSFNLENLISDIFLGKINNLSELYECLEYTKDEKEKFDQLKKGVEQLANFKVNYHDENTIEC